MPEVLLSTKFFIPPVRPGLIDRPPLLENLGKSLWLPLTMEETLALLNDTMGLSLSPENVAELDRRTEGWAAGLQMAAFALQDIEQAEVTSAIQAFSGRHH